MFSYRLPRQLANLFGVHFHNLCVNFIKIIQQFTVGSISEFSS